MHFDVLITGCNGFIGKYMCNHFIANGLSVLGIDKHDVQASYNFTFLKADLSSEIVLNDVKIDHCIHLASDVGGILYNANDAVGMIDYNNNINKNLLTILNSSDCSKMVFFSSINVFENDKSFYHDEVLIKPSITPYAISKWEGETFFRNNISNLTIIRPTNVFGKMQTAMHDKVGESHVIPDLLKKISHSNVINVLGDGTQVRNFVHVQDIVEYVFANLNFTGLNYNNLRSDMLITINTLVMELIKYASKECDVIYQKEYMKFEHFKIKNFDISPILKKGWHTKFNSIQDGLKF